MLEYAFDLGVDAPTLFEYGGLLAPLSMPPCPSQSPAKLDTWLGARPGQARASLFLFLLAHWSPATRFTCLQPAGSQGQPLRPPEGLHP